MKKILFLMVAVLALGLVFAGCSEIANITAPGNTTGEEFPSLIKGSETEPEEIDLLAGQNMMVGKILVWNDNVDEKLCVEYQLNEASLAEGWLIYETHLVVTTSLNEIAQTKKGNPIPGQFPYGDDNLEGLPSYKECFSFNELGIEPGDEVVIAAHAVVQKWDEGVLMEDETAWGDGTRFNENGNWATYFYYIVDPYANIPPEWLGEPQYNPEVIFTLEQTKVYFNILVNKKSDELASESPVKLYKYSENSNWVLLDEMFDDGYLGNHGDEIKGDRVYSNVIDFYEENTKEIPLKIEVTTSDNLQYAVQFTLSVIEDMSEKIIKDTNELSDLAEQKVIEIMQSPPSNLDAVIQMLRDYLAELTYVESCEIFDNIIEITFDTGVVMEIRLTNMDEGIPPGGANLTKLEENTKLLSNKNREEEYIPIPIESQTTGGDGFGYYLPRDTYHYLESKDASGIEYIGNRNVFVYDPFYEFNTEWNFDVGSTYKQIFDNSGIDFNTDAIYRDNQADIETLKTISNYGIVIIHTHGSGKTFVTGLEANETNKENYQNEMTKDPYEIYISKNLNVSWDGNVEVPEDRLGVTRYWFNSSNFPKQLPNSIIFNNSCLNGNESFYNAFNSIGASTYYGHDSLCYRDKAIEWTSEVLEGLIDGKTTGEAYVERSNNWIWKGNNGITFWKIFGKDNVKIPETIPFSNGGFEDDFTNWEKEGDGRILSALDFLEPTEGVKMGIISTGLGYTDKYGSLSQTFTVGTDDTTLQFDWNYISEELLEWIGTPFQDPFKVTLTKVDDSSTSTLLYKTVDNIAADFGATQEYGGDLVYVSPDIVFDQGDVWMTDWQNSTYDISAFQGNDVTITFEAEDLGDEIFDTVILLDDIKVY
jgi:hypothetical protein